MEMFGNGWLRNEQLITDEERSVAAKRRDEGVFSEVVGKHIRDSKTAENAANRWSRAAAKKCRSTAELIALTRPVSDGR